MSGLKKLVPLLDRVLVEKITPPAKSVGGVLLPESAVQKVGNSIGAAACVPARCVLQLPACSPPRCGRGTPIAALTAHVCRSTPPPSSPSARAGEQTPVRVCCSRARQGHAGWPLCQRSVLDMQAMSPGCSPMSALRCCRFRRRCRRRHGTCTAAPLSLMSLPVPRARFPAGELVPVSVKEGDKVLLPDYGGTTVKLEEKE